MSKPNPLAEYNRKRDFEKTAEPSGKIARSESGNRFIVQKHWRPDCTGTSDSKSMAS